MPDSVFCALRIRDFFVDVLYKSTFTYLLTLTAAWVQLINRYVKFLRPNWPRGQNIGLGLGLVTSGLGLSLGLKTFLASASDLSSALYFNSI